MISRNVSIKPVTVLKIFEFILEYISYMPLTYVVLYCLTMAIVLLAGSSAETTFVKILFLTLGIKGGNATLNSQDVMQGFFFWWLITGTVLHILKWLTHLDFINSVLTVIALLAGIGTAALITKTGAAFVPVVLLALFVINILIYYAFKWMLLKVKVLSEKI